MLVTLTRNQFLSSFVRGYVKHLIWDVKTDWFSTICTNVQHDNPIGIMQILNIDNPAPVHA